MNHQDRYSAMLEAVRRFHEKHDFKNRGGEDLVYRVALLSEELGEIAECITKGKPKEALAEECADLLILILGTALSADLDLNAAFWTKMAALEHRTTRTVNGRVRVTKVDSATR